MKAHVYPYAKRGLWRTKQGGTASLKRGSNLPIGQECLRKSYQADDLKLSFAKVTFFHHSVVLSMCGSFL
jgi:hypothetical protein